MLKISQFVLFTTIPLIVLVSINTASGAIKWERIGKINTGEILELDANSPDKVGYGEAVNFTYRTITGKVVKIHQAGTEDCFRDGKLSGHYHSWYVKQTNDVIRNPRPIIKAQSNASKKMLELLCTLALKDKNPELGIQRKNSDPTPLIVSLVP